MRRPSRFPAALAPLLAALLASGCPPPKVGSTRHVSGRSARAPLGGRCAADGDCFAGLVCSAAGRCDAAPCEALGDPHACKPGCACCPLPPALFDLPRCLPDCRGHGAERCVGLLGRGAQCNAESGCCHLPKVLGPPPP